LVYRTGAKYFRDQRVVFDGWEASELRPSGAHLLSLHPHGILTIGFSLSSTDPVLDPCGITWLVTEALMVLPFIRCVDVCVAVCPTPTLQQAPGGTRGPQIWPPTCFSFSSWGGRVFSTSQ
jgi:hypothetical protein